MNSDDICMFVCLGVTTTQTVRLISMINHKSKNVDLTLQGVV